MADQHVANCQICGKPMHEWSLKGIHDKCWKRLSKKEKQLHAHASPVKNRSVVVRNENLSEEDQAEKERRIQIYQSQVDATGRVDFTDSRLRPRIADGQAKCA